MLRLLTRSVSESLMMKRNAPLPVAKENWSQLMKPFGRMDAEQLSSLAQAERFKWEKALEAELWTARIDVHMTEEVRLPLPAWAGPSALQTDDVAAYRLASPWSSEEIRLYLRYGQRS